MSFPASETESNTGTNETATFDPQYYKQLETLNQGVCTWISRHVAHDPYVDLSPVFSDYNKHMANIDAKFRLKDTKVQDTRTGTKAINDVSSKDQTSFSGFPTPASSFVPTTTNINGGKNDFLETTFINTTMHHYTRYSLNFILLNYFEEKKQKLRTMSKTEYRIQIIKNEVEAIQGVPKKKKNY